MVPQAMVHRKLAFADSPASQLERRDRAFGSAHSDEKTAWARFKTAAGELVEDARDTFKRAKKGLEPVSKVKETQLLVPAEVVIGQYGPAIIARRGQV